MSQKANILERLLGRKKQDKPERLLLHAEKEAGKIVSKAGEQAEKIIEGVKLYNRELSDTLEKKMDKIEQAYLVQFAKNLEENDKILLEEVKQRKMKLIDEELAQYRRQEEEKLRQMVVTKVNELAKELLGHTLTDRDHEELLMKAMDKAKKDFHLS